MEQKDRQRIVSVLTAQIEPTGSMRFGKIRQVFQEEGIDPAVFGGPAVPRRGGAEAAGRPAAADCAEFCPDPHEPAAAPAVPEAVRQRAADGGAAQPVRPVDRALSAGGDGRRAG